MEVLMRRLKIILSETYFAGTEYFADYCQLQDNYQPDENSNYGKLQTGFHGNNCKGKEGPPGNGDLYPAKNHCCVAARSVAVAFESASYAAGQ